MIAESQHNSMNWIDQYFAKISEYPAAASTYLLFDRMRTKRQKNNNVEPGLILEFCVSRQRRTYAKNRINRRSPKKTGAK